MIQKRRANVKPQEGCNQHKLGMHGKTTTEILAKGFTQQTEVTIHRARIRNYMYITT